MVKQLDQIWMHLTLIKSIELLLLARFRELGQKKDGDKWMRTHTVS